MPTIPHTAPSVPASAHPVQRDQAIVSERGRDLRIDFLRGLCVIGMIIDHVAGPSWLYAVTGGNHFYTSAAEGFVFISGLVAGRAYTRFIERQGLSYGLGRLLNRAGQLYLLAVALTLIFAPASEWLHLPWALGWDAQDTTQFVVGVLTLHRTYYLVDVLSLYVLLLAASTGVFVLLLRGQTLLVLGGSWAVWLLYQLFPDQASVPWTIAGNNLFFFAAWQVLFFTALVIGHHWERGHLTGNARVARVLQHLDRPMWRQRVLRIGATLLAACVVVYLFQDRLLAFVFRDAPDPATAQAQVLTSIVGKADLRLGRLVAFSLVFVVLFLVTTEWWSTIRRWFGWLVLPLGQNALFAYSAHVCIALAAGVALQHSDLLVPTREGQNAALQLGAVALVWVLVQLRALRVLFSTRPVPVAAPAALSIAALVVLPYLEPQFSQDPTPPTAASAAASSDSAAAQLARAYGTVIPPGTQPELPASVLAPPIPQDAPSATDQPIPDPATPQPARSATITAQPASKPVSQPVSKAAGELHGTLLEPSFLPPALNTTERYFIYLPPNYQTGGKRFPVLYMLHGGGGRQEWITDGLIGAADQAIAAGSLPPMIIVLPQGDQGYWVNHINGGPRWGDYLAQDVVQQVDANFPTLPDAPHRAIGGLSMGGWGALYQAFSHPDEFGVVGAHAASLHGDDGSMPFLPRGAGFGQFDPLQLATSAPGLERLRVWLDAGDQDPWVDRDADLHARLDQRHIANEWHEFPGKHGGSYWHDHIQEYLAFYSRALTTP